MNRSFAAFVAILLSSCATRNAIVGKVVDRNGQPMDRVIVSLKPGDVELITDNQGGFAIDYMRDQNAKRIKLEKRQDYSIELFRTGYHVGKLDFYYKRGELVLEPVTMNEDTIRVENPDVEVDPTQFRERTQGGGATYEGE
jgi:hypothetical protein